jgi:hypothetical protein
VPSYSPVFSQGFIYWSDSTPNDAFEVPAGFTAVVRDFTAVTLLGDVLIGMFVQQSASAPSIPIAYSSVLGAAQSYQWQGRVVVDAGGFVTIAGAALGYELGVYVGGYLLRNVLT